jgi:hypothetical protein
MAPLPRPYLSFQELERVLDFELCKNGVRLNIFYTSALWEGEWPF